MKFGKKLPGKYTYFGEDWLVFILYILYIDVCVCSRLEIFSIFLDWNENQMKIFHITTSSSVEVTLKKF